MCMVWVLMKWLCWWCGGWVFRYLVSCCVSVLLYRCRYCLIMVVWKCVMVCCV